MADEKLSEEFGNWGGGGKTARPANVGPHDRSDDQHDPGKKGVTPADYKVNPDDSVAKAPPGESGEEANVNIPVKGAEGGTARTDDQTHNKPKGVGDVPRTAPPLTGTAQE